MASRWLILADDLTGAADCAIAFARRGRSAVVQWGEAGGAAEEDVVSHDADSRQLGAAAAASRHAALAGRLHRPDVRVFKKIDSTLRGQPAAELAATLAVVREHAGAAFGILAPAFPATGRTTRDGRILVAGRPLEETELWRRDHTYPTGALAAMLDAAGLASTLIALDTVRAGDDALRAALAAAARDSAVAVVDAARDDDLARIAAAGLALGTHETLGKGPLWIGSAGLAHALAAAEPAPPAPAPSVASGPGGTLVVVGSLAAISRAAARKLAAEPRMRHVPVAPDWLLGADEDERRGWCATVAARLAVGDDVLVEVAMGEAPDLRVGSRLAASLGALLAPTARHLGGLVATGGETAAALLAHFGVEGLVLIDEIEPGVSLGVTRGRITVPIVTKAGAFGSEDTLARAIHHLRAIRHEGSPT
ncbi:four-carbon acid sugar kinase family protein [Methylobacterium terricola]|uniref:Four-carbon acid sugar kinase family protein n=1 Tax=Methylobacterium terricola TaxID=2583531 RepID=A0A5C4LNW7_9HYPH|nr:four-carbon acid sugar kinase family protein [Methylobacterium terricola]TNC16078.1 four-carbon acid sugar kinase family protein [Methylobacterium terricola]